MTSNSSDLGLGSLKQILQLTFESNLKVLQQYFPQFYNRFKDYTPESYGLEIDDNGSLNIAANGHFIYDEDPQTVSRNQFELYSQAPTRSVYQLNIKSDENTDDLFEHIGLLKKLAVAGNAAISRSASHPVYEKPNFYPIMCVIGVGLGYHLEYLTNENIGHLHIYEPNPDFFYASLFVVNYTALLQKFTQANRRLSLVIGVEPEKYIEELHRSLMEVGSYQAAMLPVYKTYTSPTVDEALTRFLDSTTNFYSGFGFIEDEIISINHTIQNLKNKYPFLSGDLNLAKQNNKPVFICGSGPSLDDSIDFLVENRDKINIFCGGSALVPLYKAGIVPDLHFEIERTEELADWVSVLGDPDYFSKVTLITMNTVSPKVIDLFGAAYLYAKPNDGGTDLLLSSYPQDFREIMLLFASNPTVTNAATAFAARTGFKKLYFVGMDLGFKDEKNHHSKHSIYYGDDSYFEDEYEKVRGGLKNVDGNFTEKVLTTAIFDWARHSIEYVLRRPQYLDIEAFNCSDGAKIFRAKPLRIDDVELDENATGTIVEQIAEQSLATPFDDKIVTQKVIKSTQTINAHFQFLGDKKFLDVDMSLEEMMHLFHFQFNTIYDLLTAKDLFAGRTIMGSLNYLQSTITGKLYTIRSEQVRKEFAKEALTIVCEYFARMETIFNEQVTDKLETK